MNTQIITEKNETEIENEVDTTGITAVTLTLPSKIIRAKEQTVITTVLGHWEVVQQTANSEDLFVQLFVELFDMDHGKDARPSWLNDEVTDTVVAEVCICGPNGVDADCQVHYNAIADRVGLALSLSMQ